MKNLSKHYRFVRNKLQRCNDMIIDAAADTGLLHLGLSSSCRLHEVLGEQDAAIWADSVHTSSKNGQVLYLPATC